MKKPKKSITCEHGKNYILEKCDMCAESAGRPTHRKSLFDELRWWLMGQWEDVNLRRAFKSAAVICGVVAIPLTLQFVGYHEQYINATNPHKRITASGASLLANHDGKFDSLYDKILKKSYKEITLAASDGELFVEVDPCFWRCDKSELQATGLVINSLIADGFTARVAKSDYAYNVGNIDVYWE